MISIKYNFPLFKRAIALSFLLSIVFLFIPFFASAEIGIVPKVAGLGDITLSELIVNIIQLFLGFLGLIALVIIIYAGFIWMTSGGNEDKISKAKDIMKAGIIGLIIIIFSYAIATFVIGFFVNQGLSNGNGDGDGNDNGYTEIIGGTFGDGALGGGVIEYHYPQRNQKNVPRNTMIMITFKVAIATSTIVGNSFDDGSVGDSLCDSYTVNNTNGNQCGKLHSNIQISNNGDEIDGGQVVVVLQADGKSILIDPVDLLGVETTNTNTNVHLMQGILSIPDEDNEQHEIFGGMQNGYSWNFEVSTFADTTPPRVTRVWPKINTTVARNAIIKVNFSEPINILSINGNITAIANSDSPIYGTLRISNGYKTLEFFSSGSCGDGVTMNSCGETVFCLPPSSTISVLVNGDLPNGISDASGNYLDGNSDNIQGGDFIWNFNTNDTINITAPQIISTVPSNAAETILINTTVSALFDKPMSPSSVTTDNFYIYKEGDECLADETPEDGSGMPTDCFPNYSSFLNDEDDAKIQIKVYSPYLETNTYYKPRANSFLKDSYGNCFYPSLGVCEDCDY